MHHRRPTFISIYIKSYNVAVIIVNWRNMLFVGKKIKSKNVSVLTVLKFCSALCFGFTSNPILI